MKVIHSILLVVPFVMACAGEEKQGNTAATLADIVGIWDISDTAEYKEYMLIDEYGYIFHYDHYPADFDFEEGCYDYYEGNTLVDLGDGNFEVSDGIEYQIVSITISANNLNISDAKHSISYSKASLEESDFTPLCD